MLCAAFDFAHDMIQQQCAAPVPHRRQQLLFRVGRIGKRLFLLLLAVACPQIDIDGNFITDEIGNRGVLKRATDTEVRSLNGEGPFLLYGYRQPC